MTTENPAGAVRRLPIVTPAEAIRWQADHTRRNSGPVTARVVEAFLGLVGSDTAIGRRLRDWPDLSLEQAMPLRLAGGFHNLHLTGADARLAPIYAGAVSDQAEVDAIVAAVADDHDTRLAGWLDGPPQTNEAGRSASIVAALLWLSAGTTPRFELNEIGASAGINTMIDRYAYDLGGVKVGPADSPMRIAPEWRGAPPPAAGVEIAAIRGCDVAPVDLTDPAQALRLKSYVWAKSAERLARVDAAIALAGQRAPDVEAADAGDWVVARLAAPQARGLTRVFYHSIVWQYLPDATRARIAAAMADAGARATADRPLAWVQLETNRETFRHELRVRHWPGDSGNWTLLAQAHAHGAWVEWLDGGRADQG